MSQNYENKLQMKETLKQIKAQVLLENEKILKHLLILFWL